MRSGRKAARRTLVVHARRAESAAGSGTGATGAAPTRVGFVVARAVGGAVARNRVKRRLRAQVAARLSEFDDGWCVVVRALPPSATAASATLGADLDSALRTVLRPAPAGVRGSDR
jgi:ribonuclease P protein component